MSDGTSHIDDHPLIRAMEHELATVPGAAAAKDDWEVMLDLARRQAAQSNGAAAFIMHDYYVTKRPFVLFLRSFEMEAYDYLTPEGPAAGERKVFTALAGPSHVEEKLAAALAGRLGVLGIANPSQLLTTRGLVPRLQLPNEGWQAVAQDLVAHAHFIVMDCDSLSSGVRWELETILAAGREDATVIVLPPPEEAQPWEGALQNVVEVLGGTVVKRGRPAKEEPALAAFRRVAGEDEIAFDRLDASLLCGDLFASALAQAAAAPPFDPREHAALLNKAGVALFDEKRFAEAMDLNQQALVLRRHIDDRPGLLTSLLNIGCIYLEAGQPADALPAFTESLGLARELTRPAEEGLLASYIGVVHKELGHVEEARQWLLDAYKVQREHGEPAAVENTLVKLSQVFEATGDGDGMVACFKELGAYQQQRGDRAGELRAKLRLGTTYYAAGLPAPAAQVFEESLRLSREVGDREREEACTAMLERIKAERGVGG